MKKTYCDRCGKEVERWKFITNEKCLRYAGRIGPNPKFISDNPVDLCADCQQILDEYCNKFMKELKENGQETYAKSTEMQLQAAIKQG